MRSRQRKVNLCTRMGFCMRESDVQAVAIRLITDIFAENCIPDLQDIRKTEYSNA
jgi:hypothetical protein